METQKKGDQDDLQGRPGSVLSSQGHAQLLSPLERLTSVFGMSTGVSVPLSPPDH